jgi:hypothetical protein
VYINTIISVRTINPHFTRQGNRLGMLLKRTVQASCRRADQRRAVQGLGFVGEAELDIQVTDVHEALATPEVWLMPGV